MIISYGDEEHVQYITNKYTDRYAGIISKEKNKVTLTRKCPQQDIIQMLVPRYGEIRTTNLHFDSASIIIQGLQFFELHFQGFQCPF